MSRSITSIDQVKIPDEYKLERYEYINEVRSFCMLLKHVKSGARVMLLSNKDDNKVFSIGFRTPAKDDTGTQHIIEHTVLCGSDAFPAKDPFVELVKGSLNTFLNAITYPDRTIYPVASCNEQDFKNLTHVYMDAVFHPNIYKYEEIFRQEGWHYEIDKPEDPVTLNGVVYNEMKGAYSSAEDMLENYLMKQLFPDTEYSHDSGGDPQVIPALDREKYLDYHRNYYHPSNSYIYLYGDFDIEERLNWMNDAYLKDYDAIEPHSEIHSQKPFEAPKDDHETYAVALTDKGLDRTYYLHADLLDITHDREKCLAVSTLAYVLFNAPGAVLKKAFIDNGLGDDVDCDFTDIMKQGYIAVTTRNAAAGRLDDFKRIYRETLEKVLKEGLDKTMLEATLNSLEFKDREADFGMYPKGLYYYLDAMKLWIYDESMAFDGLRYEDMYRTIREKLDTGYFEDIIRTYLLDNPHSVDIEMDPEPGLSQKIDAETAKNLADFKASLTAGEIDELIKKTKSLKAYQSEPTPDEDLKKIPLLRISDIRKDIKKLDFEETVINGIKTVLTKDDTNGISYIKLSFDADKYKEYAAELSFFMTIIGSIDTEDHSYNDFDTLINMYTGGLTTQPAAFKTVDQGDTHLRLEINVKCLDSNIEKAVGLIIEMLYRSVYTDTDRIDEILKESLSRLKAQIMSAGHSFASGRAESYMDETSFLNDQLMGIGQYEFLSDLDKNFDSKKEAFIADCQAFADDIFTAGNLIAAVGIDEEGIDRYADNVRADIFKQASGTLEAGTVFKVPVEIVRKNEAFTTPSKVQYVAVAGEAGTEMSMGINRVIMHLLNYTYLWNNIRVLGGAYGVGCRFYRDNTGVFRSFRDPHIKETIDIYRKTGEYLKSYAPDEREMTKMIIGAVGTVDTPLTPSMKASRNISAYFAHLTNDYLQEERDAMLSCSPADINKAGEAVGNIGAGKNICVIGSEELINKEKNIFMKIVPLT
ncbi:MAG: insulinase family protein [Lachnospiraceae bacterium]|jgi:Zn-dependent M16 (insulinase) family peptidase|nr:insulinase family protein [Lachnospiraceae bacterium]